MRLNLNKNFCGAGKRGSGGPFAPEMGVLTLSERFAAPPATRPSAGLRRASDRWPPLVRPKFSVGADLEFGTRSSAGQDQERQPQQQRRRRFGNRAGVIDAHRFGGCLAPPFTLIAPPFFCEFFCLAPVEWRTRTKGRETRGGRPVNGVNCERNRRDQKNDRDGPPLDAQPADSAGAAKRAEE